MSKLRMSLLVSAFLIISSLSVQAQHTFELNEIVTTQKTISGNVYYSLNKSLFENPDFKNGAEFSFHTSAGEAKDLIIYRKKEYLPGYVSIIAAEKGSPGKVFSATYANGRLNGQLYTQSGPTLFLKYDAASNQNFITTKLDEEERPLSCGIGEEHETLVTPGITFNNSSNSGKQKTKAANKWAAASSNYASLDDSITIDLMLVYTNAAKTWATTTTYGNISGVMAQAMNLSQTALDNSKLNIELRLVHTHNTTYDETNDNVNSNKQLRRLTQNTNDPVFDDPSLNDHMDDVHTLRDQYGADIVSLLLITEETGGLGWRLNNAGGESSYGFNLDRVKQIATGYTLIHEIGHNMGNAHSRTQNKNAASQAGGLFHYSAGFQDSTNGFFHTVMAYDQTSGGKYLNEVPIFSSPNLRWQGNPTGTNSTVTPEDNALSMQQAKRVISGYRATIQSSPTATLSSTDIEVEMNREEAQQISVDISNTGASGLVWGVDFDFVSGSVQNKIATNKNRKRIQPVNLEHPQASPANYSRGRMPFKQKAAEVTLYETSFENADGFWGGTYLGRAEWRSLNDTEFEISSDHPSSGSQHLRLAYDGGDTKFIASPFFGYQLFGTYEVSIDFSISDTSETFAFYIFDGLTGNSSSGVIISGGTIYAEDIDESGEDSFLSTSGSVTPNTYNTLKIVYNTDNETIDYYLNGNLLTQNDYLDGFTPGVIQVLHRNNELGAYMDVDNIKIKQGPTPYDWLSILDKSGVTFENETGTIGLNFNTEGIAAGTYQTVMKVSTNDPNKPVIEVPITLTVDNTVSNEPEELPNQMALNQNYPNPFNPSTIISYTLKKAQNVQLDVFNIQGQKVATLQNEKVTAGSHQLRFDASKLASGIYIYRLKTAEQSLTRQMVLIK